MLDEVSCEAISLFPFQPRNRHVSFDANGRVGSTTLMSVILTIAGYSALAGVFVVMMDVCGAVLLADFATGKYLEAVTDADGSNLRVKPVARLGNSVVLNTDKALARQPTAGVTSVHPALVKD